MAPPPSTHPANDRWRLESLHVGHDGRRRPLTRQRKRADAASQRASERTNKRRGRRLEAKPSPRGPSRDHGAVTKREHSRKVAAPRGARARHRWNVVINALFARDLFLFWPRLLTQASVSFQDDLSAAAAAVPKGTTAAPTSSLSSGAAYPVEYRKVDWGRSPVYAK
ncbi:hypothetical protein MRX96_016191 [Rhipicephalus microplus]